MQDNTISIGGQDIEDEGFGIDIKKAIARFIDHWKVFVFFALLAVALAYLYLKYATPVYKIDATLMIQDPDKGGNLFGSTTNALSSLGDLFGTKSSVDNEAQVLKTGDLTLNVARELKLYITISKIGRFKKMELYDRAPFDITVLGSPDSINTTNLQISQAGGDKTVLYLTEETGDGTFSDTVRYGQPVETHSGNLLIIKENDFPSIAGEKYQINIQPLSKAATALQKSLTIDIPSKEVTTIDLELVNSDRHRGVVVLSTLINQYIHRNINQKNAFADSTIAFINNRIAIVNDELSGIEKKVQTFQEQNKIADIKEQASQIIDNENDNQKDLTQASVQKQIVESAIKYLEDDVNNHRPVPSLLASPDPTFLVLLEKYNTMQVEGDKMSLGNTDQNPTVVNLNNQIANLRKDLITNLKNQLSAIDLGLSKLQDQNNQVNAFIQSAPEKQREYLGLAREQDIKQALFIYLLQKKEEVAVTKASNISSCVIIDTPKAAEIPSSPKRSLIYLFAIIGALGLPYLLLLIKEALNNKITGPQDLAHTEAISLGEVGRNLTRASIVIYDKSRSLIAEQFRILRTNLQFTLGDSNCPVILITSSMAGEGKSFISTNLALAYASNGKNVLLMELDLRKPKIAERLSIDGSVGFSSYIISKSDVNIKEIIYSTEASASLQLLAAGPIPPNPSELLSSPKTKALIDELKTHYDLIIMDTSPIGLVTDAQLLAQHADITLYIVRQNYTFKHQTNIITNLIQSGKIPKLYTVMNDATPKTSSRYGYDSAASYGYGYGYGYIEKEKMSWWKKMTLLKK